MKNEHGKVKNNFVLSIPIMRIIEIERTKLNEEV